MFFKDRGRGHCHGCPVFKKTGQTHCSHTPYGRALHAHQKYGMDSREFKRAAKTELAFLKSLVPTRKPKPTRRK